MVRIKTASGRVIEVTPIHKLPIYNPDGYIEEREARDIAPGTYLVIPRKISIPAETPRIPIEELGKYDDVVSRDSEVNEKVRKVLRQMLSRGLVDKIVKETGLSKLTIRGIIYSKQYSVPLKLIVAINRLSKDEVIGYPTILGLRRSKYSIRVPHYINCDIAELLGLIVSNGMVTHRTIRFFSNNDMIRKRFNVLLEKAFGIRGKERVFNAVKSIEVNSALLARLFKLLGIPDKRKSRKVRVPLIIMRSPEEIIAAFIRGLYLGDGTFSKNTVEYMSGSKELITDLSYLLTRLGILYSVKFGKGKNRLYISRIPELTKFYRVILREAPCIKNIENLKRYIGSRRQEQLSREAIPISSKLLREVYRALSKRKLGARGINVGNYVYGYENPSRSGLLKLATTLGSISYQEQMKIERLLTVVSNLVNLLEHIALDKVEEVEVLRRHTTVYDLTVEDTHNFIGGLIPVIYHNTVTLQELTKWSYANVTIYIGCGERGNEMADALHSFLKLQDPRSGRPLIERAIFIANTSNMPVAAREASIYMGITIAEYFRDMGYDVLLVADSTSRWAEAMREISGRLEEMPGEEGFPAYLGSRIAEFYERTGRVIALGDPERVGSVTVVGAVSPPGADFSEPVTQNTLRYIRTLLALDVALANRRHFPAINWLISYSLYVDEVADWWAKNVHPKWKEYRTKTMELLQREAELSEVVRLVGPDALPEPDKLVLEVAKMIREDFLFQSAYHPIDKHSPPERTMMMIEAILKFYEYAKKAVEHGYPVSEIRSLPIRYKIARMRDIPKEEFKKRMEELMKEIETTFIKLLSG
ncbi:MAG TPA: V-type ATP synthase subunit A [Acidilobales archaeon]|nr:V-type ATP synthase subunit A [Acidilobales archaeon]